MVRRLLELEGVGVLTAMVFLSEIGDVTRFKNRRQIAAYLGLAPTAHESGQANDRKGHITRQGSARLRAVLCQASWNRVRFEPREKEIYARIKAKNPKAKKKAVVAAMRRLGIRMWHTAMNARAEEARLKARHGTAQHGWLGKTEGKVTALFLPSLERQRQTETTGLRPLQRTRLDGNGHYHGENHNLQ
jgi:hypothetical protein